jgi:hypothetical protein
MIPGGWDVRHRPTAEQAMTAQVRILRHTAAGSSFDPDTGQTTFTDPATVWTGWARLQRPRESSQTRSIGDRQVTIRGVTVSIPVDAVEVRVGDEVRVLGYRDAGMGDPHLVGRPLWVHDIVPGSLLWQRDLTALDAPPTAR